MKRREVKVPEIKKQSLQAIIDFLSDNGVSEIGVQQFIHLNLPALGGDKNIMDCIREGEWDDAWRVSQQFIDGDYF